MQAIRLAATRFLTSLATLLAVSFIVFAALEILPGDVATRILGRNATPESLAAVREQLGLDQPALVRYGEWLAGVVQGDLGASLVSGRPVADALAAPLANTVILSLFALLLYVPIATAPAILQALRRDRSVDHWLSVATLVVASIPDFLLGTLLLLLFSVALSAFPVLSTVREGMGLLDWLQILALPGLTLALVMAAYAIRMLRNSLIEALDAEHVTMAALRGLSWRRVFYSYTLPTALVPTINVTALNISYLIGGVVVVEEVFSYPGFGRLAIDAFQLRDLPMIEATILIAAGIFIAANLIADLAAIALNPRLRSQY